ncbi:hypothetical protein HII17_08360 [Thalassotalea sp. M1531]|uniref:Uncharacterized protein n=1 Tax=Thalassotalea algicola TaxID=2716224 RepID=A0A7Y0LCG7_9GAMM|nr:hypothetical protein [Thalassotalea algicola]NMP31572.1 hypothetical protein [Thalassotalea algicola]
MTPVTIELSDTKFRQQFESCTLDPAYFNHLGHLRIAWLYLSEFPLEKAVDLACSGIKFYAESLGATDKFNYTITDAIIRIIHRRIKLQEIKEWSLFLSNNEDLVLNALEVLLNHYSKALLFSNRARQSLVQPDIKTI